MTNDIATMKFRPINVAKAFGWKNVANNTHKHTHMERKHYISHIHCGFIPSGLAADQIKQKLRDNEINGEIQTRV